MMEKLKAPSNLQYSPIFLNISNNLQNKTWAQLASNSPTVGLRSSAVSPLNLANSKDFPAWPNPIAITEYVGLGAAGSLQQSFWPH